MMKDCTDKDTELYYVPTELMIIFNFRLPKFCAWRHVTMKQYYSLASLKLVSAVENVVAQNL